jgi:hypothetical protein
MISYQFILLYHHCLIINLLSVFLLNDVEVLKWLHARMDYTISVTLIRAFIFKFFFMCDLHCKAISNHFLVIVYFKCFIILLFSY